MHAQDDFYLPCYGFLWALFSTGLWKKNRAIKRQFYHKSAEKIRHFTYIFNISLVVDVGGSCTYRVTVLDIINSFKMPNFWPH